MRNEAEEHVDLNESAHLMSSQVNESISSVNGSQELVVEGTNGYYFHGIIFFLCTFIE